jgi:hypothetical protein
MATSRQTPRVWSDAIRGTEILANWFKLGANAAVLWLSIGLILGGTLGGLWFLEVTTSLDRRLWLHHVRNGLGIGGPIADLPDPNGSGERIHVPKAAVQRYTVRSFETVSRRVQESLFLAFLVAVAGTGSRPAIFFARAAARRPKTGISGAPPSPLQVLSQP